ncbi:MAG: hypothetical protein PHU44_14845 [Syntrophales bacterium]|nr:hypothetical protein [Syntrophales bacterium]MDD5641828.1 hypothetical protein [Syntrophales bacterium]
MARLNYVEFYYSSKHKPDDKYKCDNANVMNLLKSLQAKGVETEAIDIGDVADPFKQYHKASSGPSSEYRPIFGEVRGSDYKDYFGKTIPALCCYAKKGDRAPLEVFPRSDKKLGRVYLIEEWLENYIGELEGRSEAPEAR